MKLLNRRSAGLPRYYAAVAGWGLFNLFLFGDAVPQKPATDPKAEFATAIRPLMQKYCLNCHSTKAKKGSLDLERFTSLEQVRKDIHPWQQTIELLEAGEMPPAKSKQQPTNEERKRIIAWVRGFLDAEARARAGDPGDVPLRRLSNAEYDCTIRELTGVDLRPTRTFPADGAAGEGFTNAAEALTDISPSLLGKYLNAAKEISEHAVLLPDGFRFSAGKTRRDWTDESVARLRAFYGPYAPAEPLTKELQKVIAAGSAHAWTLDTVGRLPLRRFLAATIRHRQALRSGTISVEEVAAKEKVNPKYLRVLWQTLTDPAPSQPLDRIRARWRQASEKDVPALAEAISGWQVALWKFVPIGSYIHGNSRQVANDPAAVETVPLRFTIKPAKGQEEIVLFLVTREMSPDGKAGHIVWHRPRFEGAGKPAQLLREYGQSGRFGVEKERFGRHPDGKPVDESSLVAPLNGVTEIRLPAALFVNRTLVVEGKLDGPVGDRVVDFEVLTTRPAPDSHWDGKGPVLASAKGVSYQKMLRGHEAFRRCFPMHICFPRVVPTDEVVCLKMYHREDEPLERLFLDADSKRRLDHLWEEHRFISRQPIAEYKYLPQFIGFTTQDTAQSVQAYFKSQMEPFRKRAEEFEKEMEAAAPKQLDALLDFAGRAYRRPLQEPERNELLGLYRTLRNKGIPHEEAFRGVLSRILVAPAFLFRIEKAPPGKQAGPVNDWELATRLSYFLWSSGPDNELRRLASAGRLRDSKVVAEQVRRMLADNRVRALGIEFGTQWIHVRGFDGFNEKNEKLFPTFNADLRKVIYEESILFFQDLFQSDRPVMQVLDADYTFLNDALAKHYGIPGVVGPQWRRIEGVRKYGRGGILGLASVQAKQSAASRTSPVLRGNWVVETLLGEKLPRPPADVPRLPEEEGGADKLTIRQQVEKHAGVQQCAVCHVRIDPFGFALEHYDAIGRRRDKDQGGLPIDAKAKLKDGTEFAGMDGLRTYLLTHKRDTIEKLFCRRLLGYALGRATALSDHALIDEMVAELKKHDGRTSAAVLAIVRSPQFRMIRGKDFTQTDPTSRGTAP